MKIYDCFMYWDEDLLLYLRMNILNKIVDYFVIVEGNKTWQNNKIIIQIEIFEKNFKKVDNFLTSHDYKIIYEIKERSNYFYSNI